MTENQLIDAEGTGPFLIHSRREIISILRRLIEHRAQIRMTFHDGAEAAATSMLAVDDDGVIVDSLCDPTELSRLLASRSISFDATLDHIRIAFFVGRIEACVYDALPSLHIALPDGLIRLQRREYYRVPTPHCTIQIPHKTGTRTVKLAVQNVSAGGIALIDDTELLDVWRGTEYPDCEIDIPGAQKITATLCIMNACEVQLLNGKPAKRLGCAFVNPNAAMLAAVQRYVTKLELNQHLRPNA